MVSETASTRKADARVISPPNNAAWRCYIRLARLADQRGADMGSAFGYMLEIPGFIKNDPDHREVVRMGISQFRRQTRLLVQSLQADSRVMPELYAPIQNVVSALGNVNNLDEPITNLPSLLDREAIAAIGWAATFLPVAGDTTNHAEITAILGDVMALKSRLAGMQMPQAVLDYVDQLLRTLEQGIIEAMFVGGKSLERTYRQAVHDLQVVATDLKEETGSMTTEQKSYLSEAAEIMTKVEKLCGGFSSVITFANEVVKLIGNT